MPRVDLEVELEDRPGELVHVLEEVARFGGNLESVFHERARARGSRVPVRLAFVIDQEAVPRLVTALRTRARVTELSGATLEVAAGYLLVGHLFQTGAFLELGNAIFQAGGRLTRIQADVDDEDAPSAALFDVTAPDHATRRAIEGRLRDIARERKLSFLTSLEEASR